MALSSNKHVLKVQKLEKILVQRAALKVPEWRSYGNFKKITQNPHFLKKCKRGTKGNFSKIAQKINLVWKAQKHSGENGILLYLVCTSTAKTGEDFDAKNGSKSARMARLWQFRQGHPKPAFSKKVQRGHQRIFFKNRPKRCLRWKGPKAHWRKRHYPLISMRLKCKDWRRFRRKQRLKKGPNGQVITVFARSLKTRIFLKSAKGGAIENFQKSPKKMPSP